MVTGHNELVKVAGAPSTYEMVGLDATIIMHPQVWKCSGHFDLFCDMMTDCRQTKKRYRFDQVRGRWAEYQGQKVFVTTLAENEAEDIAARAQKLFKLRAKDADKIAWDGDAMSLAKVDDLSKVLAPEANEPGTLTPPRRGRGVEMSRQVSASSSRRLVAINSIATTGPIGQPGRSRPFQTVKKRPNRSEAGTNYIERLINAHTGVPHVRPMEV